jgi:dipeptide/tripeptide permease
MRSILAVYMAEQLGFGQANATTYNHFFIAACYFLPLVGGYVADNFFGKYRTIVWFSIPYIFGQLLIACADPTFRQSIDGGFLGNLILVVTSKSYLFISLVLLAMGSGVIKPNISTLMGMTYDQQRPGQDLLRGTAFSMFYMAINIGAAIFSFAVPIIKDTYGYAQAFMFPAGLMAIAFFIFAIGKRYYAVEVIERRHKTPEERAQQWQVLRRILGLFLLVTFFWAIFDQSSSTWIFFARSYMDTALFGNVRVRPEQMQALNPTLIVILLPGITYLFVALDRRGIKVRATDKILVGFLLTAVCMGVTALAGFLAGPMESVLAPSRDRIVPQESQQRENQFSRLAPASSLGFLATPVPSPASLVSAAVVPEKMTERYVRAENKVSIWWQALAYLAMTVAEILISVTGLELAFVAAPKNMKSFVTSIWLLTVFLGDALAGTVGRLYAQMDPGNYFLLFAGMMVVVAVLFFPVAKRFNRIIAEVGHPV